jgi:hypothetical protein
LVVEGAVEEVLAAAAAFMVVAADLEEPVEHEVMPAVREA